MRLGIDFDNTIANYTGVFHRVAHQLGWMPEHIGHSKEQVKQYFFDQNNEAQWTQLQGIVYGEKINEASPFPHCLEVLKALQAQGHELFLISHKTQYPFIGKKVDLHEAARNWLVDQGLLGGDDAVFCDNRIFFNTTKEQKLERVATLQIDVFVDDLESILLAESFPSTTIGVLFAEQSHPVLSSIQCWSKLPALVANLHAKSI
ncbi:HAD family hydrolase [Pseudoalteromonas sp. MMG022]|uniref:HAD family hydrolase n=1 Tax=Pseudoalteromonas sp. MMG022 TaxID=2909978 RepID=UPI001F20C045|nr:HAD family hydrolase [Pseudoalteromonas sp. MMG022]MCF6434689.1 HAD family hydrolase [Pseudoalteromonas sp. MMG022]